MYETSIMNGVDTYYTCKITLHEKRLCPVKADARSLKPPQVRMENVKDTDQMYILGRVEAILCYIHKPSCIKAVTRTFKTFLSTASGRNFFEVCTSILGKEAE